MKQDPTLKGKSGRRISEREARHRFKHLESKNVCRLFSFMASYAGLRPMEHDMWPSLH